MVELWGNIPVILVLFCLACLEPEHTSIQLRGLQASNCSKGKGARDSGGLKEAWSWLIRNGACRQYTTSMRDEASKAMGTRKEGWPKFDGWGE
jgi:hypothetical protein